MSESYQGITVPAGSVGALRTSASELVNHAKVLADAGTQMRGMPSSGSSWLGPAHGRYSGMCLSAAGAADQGAQGFVGAAGAASTYADELEHAQNQARAAIHEAEAAQRQIDHAHTEIGAARARQRTAQGRIDSAIHAQGVAAAAGHHNPAAAAELQLAERELHHAEDDERHWRRELHVAEDHLRSARRRGALAEQAARDAGLTAKTLFAAAAQQMPRLAPPPPPPPVRPADHGDWGDHAVSWLAGAASWTWKQDKALVGAARNASVGLVTTLYQDVHDAGEYTYNAVAHPELAQQQQWQRSLQQSQATYDAVTHPGRTLGNVVDWHDLSHGNIGAWIGNLAPALLAGGAGPTVRALRAARAASTLDRAVSAGEGDAALAQGQEAHGALRPPSTYEAKAVAADGAPTLSGWAQPRPDGFRYASPEQVRTLAQQVNHELEPHRNPSFDHAGNEPGWPGKFHASHAEKQQLLTRTSDTIAVNRPMCTDCQAMFKKYVDYTGHPLHVTDPDGSHTFYPRVRPRAHDAAVAAGAAGAGQHHSP